ncbi:hypothetical protein SADUNF_Sadunf12G0096000 [Salix dunnii]|uniref:Uncharacterized protein n=1 Tax=Salix dunnii TaxID=1413687 RepID=A0A835JNW7_9ROSI|nr:hypothetical protein SADUNF_Sadunf12G0096000 [Salix dunnii]
MVASKMNPLAGDDTTSAIILACEMIQTAMLAVAFWANPVSVKNGMDEPVKDLVGNLIAETIEKVDSDGVGNLIAETIEKVGYDRVISLESSSTSVTSVIIEGMKGSNRFGVLSLLIDKGHMPPQFITNQEKSLVEFAKAKL